MFVELSGIKEYKHTNKQKVTMSKFYGRWFLGLYLLMFIQNIAVESKNKLPEPGKESLVEIRAVFINCESDDRQDSPILRFERQELFKHNALRGCNKKLALTVKIASPDLAIKETTDTKAEMGDEYIPIDHVFEGSEKKRVRLLNPYILRLRRDTPKQAYKLHRIDTVSGVLTNTDLATYIDNMTFKKQENNRKRRELDASEKLGENDLGSAASVFTLEHENPNHHSYSVRIGRLQELIKAAVPASTDEQETTQDCGLRLFNQPSGKSHNLRPAKLEQKRKTLVYENETAKDKIEVCPKTNNSTVGRVKREKEVIMTVVTEFGGLVTPRYIKDRYYHPNSIEEDNIQLEDIQDEKEDTRYHKERTTRDYVSDKSVHSQHSNNKPKNKSRYSDSHSPARKLAKHRGYTGKIEKVNDKSFFRPEKVFALYEIGDPNLWYNIKVHLFEKLSTLEGKTVWNDLTKGVEASVSSANPEWKGQDVNVRYRPAEWLPRDDFTLPVTRLCLLEPLVDNLTAAFEDENQQLNAETRSYIVVPLEDVVYLSDKTNVNKRNENISTAAPNDRSAPDDQIRAPRRVEVRVSRAIMGSGADNFDITQLGSNQFLMLPHRRPHRSQIDVEVRADDNLIVRVGSSGRLATVVTDNSRKKRTTVYFQATNTGLASAHFKAVIRECGPELSTLLKDKGSEEISSEPILLPPHHTRRLKLEVPAEILVDVIHCNVALVNDDDESVAVRDVSIKKGDRCFCVWHCECVCLSEDPKLLCREMSQPQQVAAGLAPSERPRHARSVCYKDNIALDFCSVLISVLIFLLLLGLIKALVGIWNVRAGQIGWGRLLGTPRLLQCYYEPNLRNRTVMYVNGWPVHPDTKLTTIRVLSCPASFLLNLVFFIILPCMAIHSGIKSFLMVCTRCMKTKCQTRKVDEQIFSAHDLQNESLELIVRRKRKRNRLTDWMTPFAEQLTADVINQSMEPALNECQDEMQPLLHETKMCKSDAAVSVPDSEQEDTDYVLMQMQKSRESLASSKIALKPNVTELEKPKEVNHSVQNGW